MRPFKIGGVDFGIEGHAEDIGGRKNEFGETLAGQVCVLSVRVTVLEAKVL